jgi:flagellar biosynthesis/type III secretory pathway protein FliH
MVLSVTTDLNFDAMQQLEEMMTQYWGNIKWDENDPNPYFEMKANLKLEQVKTEGIEIGKSEGIEIGKSEGIEIGKSEGKIEGKIESAYLMMKNLGLSMEAAAKAVELSEIEQVMLRQRMAQNGH